MSISVGANEKLESLDYNSWRELRVWLRREPTVEYLDLGSWEFDLSQI
jgi:hypothetical protein